MATDREEVKPIVRKSGNKNYISIVILVVAMIGIILFFLNALKQQGDKITIVVANADITAGEKFEKGTNITRYQISKEEYDNLNSLIDAETNEPLAPLIEVTDENMLRLTGDDTDENPGRFANNFIANGTPLRTSMTTLEQSSINPYLKDLADDGSQEIYTLDFSGNDIDTRLLLPGSHLRIRGVLSVAAEDVPDMRSLIEAKESKLDAGLDMPEDGSAVIRTYASQTDLQGGDIPVAEIIFGDMQVADILNSQGESVLEILRALSNMPLNERVKLLSSSVEQNQEGDSFASRIAPAKLVLVVTRKDASQLAEFENLGSMAFKYTILAEDTKDSLYMQLRQVSDAIYGYTENTANTQ